MVPEFSPRIFEEYGIGTCYEDGRVLGAVDEGVVNGKRCLVISEWSSQFPGQGHTKAALQWFRQEGFEIIAANGVGLIEDGVGDFATAYWQHIHSLGLVDVLIDDNGVEIALAPLEASTSFDM